MKKILSLLTIYFLLTLLLFLLGCAGVPPAEREVKRVPMKPPEVPRQLLCLALIWDGKIPQAGEANPQAITNLLALLERYPRINMTFNLSPEMIEYMNFGALDSCRRLQDLGRIVVVMVPPGRPILSLLYDTDLASVAMPEASLPAKKYEHPEDVRARIMEGVSSYRKYFGKFPRGVWLPEGAVAQEVLEVVGDCRLEWMASGEEVLENSLNIELSRNDQGRLLNPEFLYRPYLVSGEKRKVTMIFRDRMLSDRINLVYPLMSGGEGAGDFMERIYSIQQKWRQKSPPLVTIIIDNDESIYFLSQLFNQLEENPSIKTVTVQEYLEDYPAVASIKKLWPGSLVNANFDSWIGEEEENIAWELLAEARSDLESYKNSGRAEIEKLDEAFATISKASDSKWFWWYGQDQNSGRDEIFDQEYRSLLIKVYQTIGIEPPGRLFQPIVAQKEFIPEREIVDLVTPQVDGIIDEGEWDNAGYYRAENCELFDKIYYGYDRSNLYLRVDTKDLLTERKGTEFFIGFYIGTPGAGKYNLSTRYLEPGAGRTLGFGLSNEAAIWFDQFTLDSEAGRGRAVLSSATGKDTWQPMTDLYSMAVGAYSLEIAIPLKYLNVSGGEALRMIAVAVEQGVELESMPPFGPISMILPELFHKGADISKIIDPVGDDYGPGTYTYPADAVFKPGSFDIREFSVSEGPEYVILKIKLGIIENPWNSPSGLSLQIVDVYIDLNNRIGAGSMQLLPGRNAYTRAEDAWEYAISVDGWQQTMYKIDSAGKPVKLTDLEMRVNSTTGEVTIYVPRKLIRGDPRNWGYLPMVLAYDGEAPPRNWKVREVKQTNDEFSFGGAYLSLNNNAKSSPNIIDLVLPRGENQKSLLGVYRKDKVVEIPAIRAK
ncbi:MAG: glucodextranase DOMON-like domain-containing protein [bacterium]